MMQCCYMSEYFDVLSVSPRGATEDCHGRSHKHSGLYSKCLAVNGKAVIVFKAVELGHLIMTRIKVTDIFSFKQFCQRGLFQNKKVPSLIIMKSFEKSLFCLFEF